MAVVLLPGGSDMAGKPVNIILPLVGQLCFQPGKLCIGQYALVNKNWTLKLYFLTYNL